MSWNADFAILYACALALFSALVVWAVPMAFFTLAGALQSWVENRGKHRERRTYHPPRFYRLPPRVPGIHAAR
jgi:hypothetical protein